MFLSNDFLRLSATAQTSRSRVHHCRHFDYLCVSDDHNRIIPRFFFQSLACHQVRPVVVVIFSFPCAISAVKRRRPPTAHTTVVVGERRIEQNMIPLPYDTESEKSIVKRRRGRGVNREILGFRTQNRRFFPHEHG